MKTIYIPSLFIGLALAFSACNTAETEKAKDDVEQATDKVGKAVGDAVHEVKEELDENLVKNVVKDNEKQIEWLRAGSKMGTDKELVDIAKKMIPDHEKIASDLRAYASKKGIKLDVDTKGVKIDSKTGLFWDEEWADKVRNMNRDMVDKFERVQSHAEETDLKDLATATLPTLRDHLNWTEKLEARLDKATGN